MNAPLLGISAAKKAMLALQPRLHVSFEAVHSLCEPVKQVTYKALQVRLLCTALLDVSCPCIGVIYKLFVALSGSRALLCM